MSLRNIFRKWGEYPAGRTKREMAEDEDMLLKRLESYTRIGSVEECRSAVSMMRPKAVLRIDGDLWVMGYKCPTCKSWVYGRIRHCGECGQKLIWPDGENGR